MIKSPVSPVLTRSKYKGGIGFSSYRQKLLIEILDFLKPQFPKIKSKVNTYTRHDGKWQVSQLQLGGTHLFIKLYNFFYSEAKVYLKRKKEKGEEVIALITSYPSKERTRDSMGRFE